jgi:ubiquinone biosynthesis protein
VATFVASLFQVQRNLRIYGSASFATAIMALAVYEGLVKEYCPQLDFQREAVPFAMAALAEHETAQGPSC